MSGEGILYYNHNKQHLRGIWSNGKLVEQIKPLTDVQLQATLDSVALIENRMRQFIEQ